VVEEDAVDGKEAVCLPVVSDQMISGELGNAIGGA